MARLTVLYDSCVLYPAPLRDLLVRLTRTDLYPDEFLLHVIALNPLAVREVIEAHQQALKNPPKPPAAYLETLLKQGLPKAVSALEKLCFKSEPEGLD